MRDVTDKIQTAIVGTVAIAYLVWLMLVLTL
ncbi:hypothetical protein LCGC14_2245270, partial [marine sediment metagenome]